MNNPSQFECAMRRALELALLGPTYGGNPQVGAVILDKDLNIIAEGWHRGAGTNHAEVDALSKLDVVPEGAIAVVTLEPCNHTGRTGPCSQALITAGIKTVVYGATDPGLESANGAETLVASGVSVIGGLLAAEVEKQQRVWLTAMRKQRPFITLKWAQTLDGRSFASDGTSKWISGPESRAHVHKLRSEIDAILVGTATVIADNPELTARKSDGELYEHQPLRVILGNTELDADSRVFNADAKTLQVKTHDLQELLDSLWKLNINHLLVEGGAKVMSSFVAGGLFDEILIYQAPQLVGGIGLAVGDIGISTMNDAIELEFTEVQALGKDILIRAELRKVN